MDFNPKKLPKAAAEEMRVCPISTVSPFALMPAPVYAFMKLNEKFVSVKAPLDFFTPEELKRLKGFEVLYFTSFMDSIATVRHAARAVRSLLSWNPNEKPPDRADARPSMLSANSLPPAPYEMADAVLRVVDPLWGPTCAIEPFFAAIFANELCDLLPGELLIRAREKSVKLHDDAVMISGWAVFLAVHLGYCDLKFLNFLRRRIFEDVSSSLRPASDYVLMDELFRSAIDTVRDCSVKLVSGERYLVGEDRISQKMTARLERVRSMVAEQDAPVVTVFGEGGFIVA